jgi:hypothetical protein
MLGKFGHLAIVAALGAATMAFHIDSASSQAPRPRSERNFEFGEGRDLPFYADRSARPSERYQFYRNGWWYDTPWWMGAAPFSDSSIAGLRVYGSGPIADPYPAEQQQTFTVNKPIGF